MFVPFGNVLINIFLLDAGIQSTGKGRQDYSISKKCVKTNSELKKIVQTCYVTVLITLQPIRNRFNEEAIERIRCIFQRNP